MKVDDLVGVIDINTIEYYYIINDEQKGIRYELYTDAFEYYLDVSAYDDTVVEIGYDGCTGDLYIEVLPTECELKKLRALRDYGLGEKEVIIDGDKYLLNIRENVTELRYTWDE